MTLSNILSRKKYLVTELGFQARNGEDSIKTSKVSVKLA